MNIYEPLYLPVLQIFVLAIAILTALFEIQIEGPHGWATTLPTWKWESRWFASMLNGKNLTGYHLYLNALLFLVLHFPLLLTEWSWQLEYSILSCFFMYLVVWDFLWFILNPHFGWHRFMKNKIWWFQKRIGPFPVDYYYGLMLSGSFAVLRGIGSPSNPLFGSLPTPVQQLIAWSMGIVTTFLFIAILAVFHTHPENVQNHENFAQNK